LPPLGISSSFSPIPDDARHGNMPLPARFALLSVLARFLC
jgi:hypothetical protein